MKNAKRRGEWKFHRLVLNRNSICCDTVIYVGHVPFKANSVCSRLTNTNVYSKCNTSRLTDVFLNFVFLSFGVRKIILWKTFTCIKEDSKLTLWWAGDIYVPCHWRERESLRCSEISVLRIKNTLISD